MNAELQDPEVQRKLSFPFAKRHGVLVRGVANGVADTVCRPGVTAQTLAEVRRFVGVPLRLERVSVESFDSMLRIAYEAGSGAAMQMLEGLDDNTDLAHLAEDIPESSDLLESDDEAPFCGRAVKFTFTLATGLLSWSVTFTTRGPPNAVPNVVL